MKKMMMIALVMLISASAFAKTPHPVKVLSKSKDVVYFKVDCTMVGASMIVYDETGTMIYSAVVTGKKTIVDFYAEPSGSYTIHLKKDGADEVIEYNKLSVSHAELASHDHISVIQL
ncbi:MAG: hypothetical protein WDO14_20455 [Bacteroidota bacterium]